MKRKSNCCHIAHDICKCILWMKTTSLFWHNIVSIHKLHLKMSSAIRRQFCSGFNVTIPPLDCDELSQLNNVWHTRDDKAPFEEAIKRRWKWLIVVANVTWSIVLYLWHELELDCFPLVVVVVVVVVWGGGGGGGGVTYYFINSVVQL